jgi:hypothetical protein
MKVDSKNLILKESFEGGLKYSLYSNFKKWTEAFLELVDNAVSNRIPDKHLFVEIFTSSKHFRIVNRGGYGMKLEDLQELLQWGKIKERTSYDLGAYSQGGKAAMGYLGRSMVIKASSDGEKILYRIEDNDLHDYNLKNYPVIKIDVDNTEGYVEIEVSGLKRKIKNEEIQSLLIDTYRPLIENKEVSFFINGEEIKVNKFPLDSDFKVQTFSFPVKKGNKYHQKVHGWIGRLISRSGIKGGLKCYKLGRLISEREFFGHPDANYKQTLNFLFGEVHLDHVPATTNKTDFDRDSSEWEEIQVEMYKILKPHIDDLLGRDIQEPTDEERDRVKKAKELVDELLRLKKINLKGSAINDLYSQGQKYRENHLKTNITKNSELSKRKNNPATPPPINPIGKRNRLKEFLDWIVRPMDDSVRSQIEEKDGKKLLVINNLFPGFITAKGNQLYLLETAAIQLAIPEEDEKLTPQEYLIKFDELYSFFCSNINKAKENLENRKLKNN